MPVFAYKAVEPTGKRIAGSVEASTLQEAKYLLREQRLIILSLTEMASKKSNSLSISKEQLVILTTQLSSLLSASVPLYEALQALEEQSKGEPHQAMIASIRESIRKGSSFSDALSKYPESFSALYRAIVVAGESVGRLDSALLRLAQLLTKERQSRQQLISALLYPAILSILLVGALIILIFFVIPAIEGLFEGKVLPTFTQVVLLIAHFVHNNMTLLVLGFAASIIGIVYSWTQPKLRARVISAALSWPIVGPFLIKSALARFARTLSSLLTGGTPLSSALVYAKEALTNQVLEAEIEQITQNIIGGETLKLGW
jgi:general secretion pathway protein F